jgi:hypothetical protein
MLMVTRVEGLVEALAVITKGSEAMAMLRVVSSQVPGQGSPLCAHSVQHYGTRRSKVSAGRRRKESKV